jgi:hypothetical protein
MGTSWVWVLAFTILGSRPEHGHIAKFETKQQCQQALVQKKEQEAAKGRELVGSCYFSKKEGPGWW